MKLALASSLFLGSSGASAPRTEKSDTEAPAAIAAIAADAVVPRRSATRASAPVRSAQPAPTADDGILAAEEPGREAARGRRLDGGCAPEDVIVCVDGEFNETASCEDACDKQCCTGETGPTGRRPCDGFTGSVCKDRASCVGTEACYDATVGNVTRGCYGTYACFRANIGLVTDGCDGYSACDRAGVDSIRDGCKGEYACCDAGYDSEAGVRHIGSISESCVGDYSCLFAACNYRGGIATISGSCNAYLACRRVGYEGDGAIPEIVDCCNTAEECQDLNAAGLLEKNCTAPSAPPSISSQPSGVPTPVPGKSSKSKSGKAKSNKGKSSKKSDGPKLDKLPKPSPDVDALIDGSSMSAAMSFSLDFEPV